MSQLRIAGALQEPGGGAGLRVGKCIEPFRARKGGAVPPLGVDGRREGESRVAEDDVSVARELRLDVGADATLYWVRVAGSRGVTPTSCTIRGLEPAPQPIYGSMSGTIYKDTYNTVYVVLQNGVGLHLSAWLVNIIGGSDIVTITVKSADEPAFINVDGEYVDSLPMDASVNVSLSEKTFTLLRLSEGSFFTVLRNKLSTWEQ